LKLNWPQGIAVPCGAADTGCDSMSVSGWPGDERVTEAPEKVEYVAVSTGGAGGAVRGAMGCVGAAGTRDGGATASKAAGEAVLPLALALAELRPATGAAWLLDAEETGGVTELVSSARGWLPAEPAGASAPPDASAAADPPDDPPPAALDDEPTAPAPPAPVAAPLEGSDGRPDGVKEDPSPAVVPPLEAEGASEGKAETIAVN
jgi:hypothetical protein